jgi:CheY-like chemotaxis protein
LIGAPPGYVGQAETVPVLTQRRLTEATSPNSDLALVLFDEIEKASQSVTRLLLGILDKGTLHLGDNSLVNFEKTLIFFTSNLGAREMMKEVNPDIGFQTGQKKPRSELAGKLENIALGAVRKRFSPEFVNRIDAIVTYQPLDQESLDAILDKDITLLQNHVRSRLGDHSFELVVEPESRLFLLRKGTSEEYGARELKRTIHRELVQPLATMVARGAFARGVQVRVTLDEMGQSLAIVSQPTDEIEPAVKPSILIVDDNHDLLLFLAVELEEAGWQILTAETAAEARALLSQRKHNVVLIDYMLGEDDGLKLAMEFHAQNRQSQIIMMTGGGLSNEGVAICEASNVPVLYKPFLACDVLNLIQSRSFQSKVAIS